MKFNLSITLTLLVFIGSHVALSQKRGKKGKSTSSDMLNMTFLKDYKKMRKFRAWVYHFIR